MREFLAFTYRELVKDWFCVLVVLLLAVWMGIQLGQYNMAKQAQHLLETYVEGETTDGVCKNRPLMKCTWLDNES